jgi:hypothetical protein
MSSIIISRAIVNPDGTVQEPYVFRHKVYVRVKEKKKTKVYSTVTCPHCGKVGNSNIINRYHFDRCKHVKS